MYKIMIADDNKIICNGIKQTILSEIPETEITGMFYNGDSLFEAIKANAPDIIICDIEMPGKTGIEICKYLHKHSPSVKIILITAYKKFEYAKAAIDYQVSYFLVKPYTSTNLINAVNTCLNTLEEARSSLVTDSNYYIDKFERSKRDIENLYLQNRKAERYPLVLLHTAPAQECSVIELTPSLSEPDMLDHEILDYDSPGLSVFYIESVCIAFFKNSLYVQNYINDLRVYYKFHNLKFFIDKSEIYTFGDWLRHRTVENSAQELKSAIQDVTVYNYYNKNDLIENMSEEDFSAVLKRAYELLTGSKYFNFTPNEDSRLECLYSFEKYVYKNRQPTVSVAEKIKLYVLNNYADSLMSFEDIGKSVNLSAKKTGAVFKAQTGTSLNDYINQVRIKNACKCIKENPRLTIRSVCNKCGFNNINYFHKIFKKHTGITPNVYKGRYI